MNPAAEPSHALDLSALMASEFHELKNQLGHLTLSLAEVASQHPELGATLQQPRLICRRIADRLVQALTLYKSDQGSLSLNISAHSPAEFIADIQAQTQALAGGRLSIVSCAENAPPFWFFDRYLVEIALLNAVHNAVQFAAGRIEISAAADAGGLRLSVRDDSRGYPQHILTNQGIDPGKSATGTGLGLFFASRIAQAHEDKGRRGEIALGNDQGAAFSLWLP